MAGSIAEQIRDMLRAFSGNLPKQRPVRVRPGGDALSPFGHQMVVEPTPLIQAFVDRFDDTRIWQQTLEGSATITARINGGGDLNITTAANDRAVLRTRRRANYKPGQGNLYRYTATFDTPVANSEQLAGPLHEEGGFAVGYNGTRFGCLHRYGRRLEIQGLQITVAAGGAETATVTLEGNATNVSLTGGGTVQDDAREIANESPYTGATYQWDAIAINDTVYFLRRRYGDATGTMSYSSTGTSAGTFTEEQQGADGTEEWVYQEDFNLDAMLDPAASDTPGSFRPRSGMILNPLLGQIYEWRVPYLGYGGPTLYIHDPMEHRAWPVHHIPWNNTEGPEPTVIDPRFPLAYELESQGSTTAMTLTGVSVYAARCGKDEATGPPDSASGTHTAGVTETPIISVQCSIVEGVEGATVRRINRRGLEVDRLLISNGGSKLVRVRVYEHGSPTVPPSALTGYTFTQFLNGSYVLFDTASTAFNTGGSTVKLIAQFAVRKDSTISIPYFETLERGEVLTITTQTDSSTSPVTITVFTRERA